jgi:hypothetical protein
LFHLSAPAHFSIQLTHLRKAREAVRSNSFSGAWSEQSRMACLWQDRHEDKFAKLFGCHWNREPLELTKTAGLKIIKSQRNFFGIFHRIKAQADAL